MAKQNTKNKSLLKRIVTRRIILSIQFVTSVVFIGIAYILKILPMKYFTAIVIILSVIWLSLMVLMQAKTRDKRKTNGGIRLAVSKLVSIIVSIALLVGSSYMIRGHNFIDMISNAFQQTRHISVYVLIDSPIENIEDLKEASIGISYKEDSTYVSKGVLELEKEMDSTARLMEIEGYTALADALYNQEVDSIIADEAYISLLNANNEHFEVETRKIATYSFVEEISSVTTDTDVTKNPFTVFVTGIDTYGDVSTVARSDVNLVVVVNPLEKQILMVSIPRDTQVTLASYNAMDKLTHSSMYGINETILTLENFLDIDLNYYAKTNFTGIIEIIDQLGGITIDSPYEDFRTLHGNYLITKGINEMDGDKALCFVRERFALPNGDLDRGHNQQLLLAAMLEKAMTSRIITNYNSILSAVEGSFETDMSGNSIRSLINMQLNDMTSWEMFNAQVTGSFVRSTQTYSMYGQNVDTMEPNTRVLNEIISVIDKMELGERISQEDVKGLSLN